MEIRNIFKLDGVLSRFALDMGRKGSGRSHDYLRHISIFLRREEARRAPPEVQRGDSMPVSKKQLEKLNKIKKAKAEELSKQADAGSKAAKKKLKKLEKKIK